MDLPKLYGEAAKLQRTGVSDTHFVPCPGTAASAAPNFLLRLREKVVEGPDEGRDACFGTQFAAERPCGLSRASRDLS